MKNLFILLCAVLLQAPVSSCMGNSDKSARKIPAAVAEDAWAQEDDSEAKTADNFGRFIKELFPEFPAEAPHPLVCTQFGSRNEVFSFLLTLFDKNSEEKERFGKTNSYDSSCLSLEYADEHIKDGFARLELTFKGKKNNSLTYTVLFRPAAE